MTLKLKATLPWHLIVIIAAGALATISAGRYVPGLPQLILGPSKALASSCAVFRQSAELFHDFTIIPTPKASTDEGPEKIARQVWHRFISHLDPDKTYFTAEDIHALHDLLKDESISPTHQGVCKAIESVPQLSLGPFQSCDFHKKITYKTNFL